MAPLRTIRKRRGDGLSEYLWIDEEMLLPFQVSGSNSQRRSLAPHSASRKPQELVLSETLFRRQIRLQKTKVERRSNIHETKALKKGSDEMEGADYLTRPQEDRKHKAKSVGRDAIENGRKVRDVISTQCLVASPVPERPPDSRGFDPRHSAMVSTNF
jgi:hypothetical protein